MSEKGGGERPGSGPPPDVSAIRSELADLMQTLAAEIDHFTQPRSPAHQDVRDRPAERDDALLALYEDAIRTFIQLRRFCLKAPSPQECAAGSRDLLTTCRGAVERYCAAANERMAVEVALQGNLRDGYAALRAETMDELRALCLEPEARQAALTQIAARRAARLQSSDAGGDDDPMQAEYREINAEVDRATALALKARAGVSALLNQFRTTPRLTEADVARLDPLDPRAVLLRFCELGQAALSAYSSRVNDARRGVFLPSDAEEVLSLLLDEFDVVEGRLRVREC